MFGFNFAFAEEANELADKIQEIKELGSGGEESQNPLYPNNDEGYYHETNEQVYPEEQQDPGPHFNVPSQQDNAENFLSPSSSSISSSSPDDNNGFGDFK